MSWHFLQEREAVSSADICWDGAAFVPSKSMTMLGGYCLPDNETGCSPTSPSGMTLRRSTEGPGAGELMWFQGDSPVRTYRPPERERDLAEAEVDCGPSLPESLARYNPATYSWRTRQYSLLGGLELFSETWPRWGMMRGGELSVPAMLAPLTSESESGLWPTPTVQDADNNGGPGQMRRNTLPLNAVVKRFRTPNKTDADKWSKQSQAEREAKGQQVRLCHQLDAGGSLSPLWVEWLMGWPLGWTDLGVLEMDRFQQWRHGHLDS